MSSYKSLELSLIWITLLALLKASAMSALVLLYSIFDSITAPMGDLYETQIRHCFHLHQMPYILLLLLYMSVTIGVNRNAYKYR